MRVVRKVEEFSVSTEERLETVEGQLRSVQDKLSEVMQLLLRLSEKGTEGSPSDPITKGDILGAATNEPSLEVSPFTMGGDGGDDEDDGGDGEEYGGDDEDNGGDDEDDGGDDEDDEDKAKEHS